MKISIVIPFYNNWSLTHQLLFDLYKNCTIIDEVILANDCSTSSMVHDGIKWWKELGLFPVIREIRNSENKGFLLTANTGMRRASGNIIILVSNDVSVKTNLTSKIHDALLEKPKSLVGNRLIDFDSGWNTFNGVTFPYLEGFLLAATRETWETLGWFDEIYAPNDYEDIDLSTKALSIGYDLISLNDIRVTHIGGQSIGYNDARLHITKRNQKKFEEKWVKK